MDTTQSSLFFFKVSLLSHYDYCFKRCKIETFGNYNNIPEVTSDNAVKIGNRMHRQYSTPYKSFDRQLLRYRLNRFMVNYAFQKQIDNIIIRGIPDDYRVLMLPDGSKTVSIIEVKTTSKKYMWRPYMRAAVFQLQLYIWLMKEHIEKLGYKLHTNHYIEVYSQKTHYLLERVLVEEDVGIENKIRYIIRSFQGLEKVTVPPLNTCKHCPKIIKLNCSWYKMRMENK